MAWFLQRVTAAVLLVTLAFHFILLHFLNHAAEVTLGGSALRMNQLAYFLTMIVFLVAAAFHGLNGIYNALLNQGLSGRNRQLVFWVTTAVGIIVVVQGVRIALAMTEVVV